jgi:hypothetical protein
MMQKYSHPPYAANGKKENWKEKILFTTSMAIQKMCTQKHMNCQYWITSIDLGFP